MKIEETDDKSHRASLILRDIAYVRGGAASQTLDLFLPPAHHCPAPLVIWIHGGAFMGGDKEPNDASFLGECGFATASINYRHTDLARFPAQIEDCNAAVRFLRAHASEFGLDSSRFGAWGSSAGGFLAAMVGTTGAASQFDVGDYLDVSSDVQAVCDWFGPTDLTTMDGSYDAADRCDPSKRLLHFGPSSPAAALLGQPIERDLQYAYQASPIAYVTGTAPPFLIVHGDEDFVIPLGQSRELANALNSAGVSSEFVVYSASGHGDGLFQTAGALSKVQQFFVTRLGK